MARAAEPIATATRHPGRDIYLVVFDRYGSDWSIKERIDENWKAKARTRIRCVDTVCVICGEHTDSAAGVSAELRIAREEEVPYFLLAGYSDKTCKKPLAAKSGDKLYKWTWDNLKALLAGDR